ncbi:MAG TPA: DUF4179 domain-containing protein [Ktedonobacterales bacterium]|nr:DUF4179 domain-containing protein [Ktedonobacterales bacterium]
MPDDTLHRLPELEDERALRAALAAHAPADVPTADAWITVRSHLALGAVPAHEATRLTRLGRRPRARRSPLRAALLASGVAALLVALMGAGYAAAYWGGIFGGPKAQLIGDANLYATIGQSRTIDGVTLSVDQAYADPGNTYIAVTVRLTPALADRYGLVILNHIAIRDAGGRETDGLNMSCKQMARADLFKGGGIEHCMLDAGALPAPAGAGPVNVTVEVGEVWLFAKGGGQRVVEQGPWTYQFALPWHAQSLGPGGPYAQPRH